jgi:hypothetical protein
MATDRLLASLAGAASGRQWHPTGRARRHVLLRGTNLKKLILKENGEKNWIPPGNKDFALVIPSNDQLGHIF